MVWRKNAFGVTMLKQPFTPQVYTKHNEHGKPMAFKQQAEATADYLSSKHWAAAPDEQARTNTIPTTPLVPPDVEYNTDPISEEELNAAIAKQKNNKVGGPDEVVMEHFKQLDDVTPLLVLLSQWWETAEGPEHITEARVASIFKQETPTTRPTTDPFPY